MRFGDLLGTSLTSLWHRKFRTSLTVLGVVIGTMAVVVMVSLGVGLSKAQMDSLEQFANLRQIDVFSPPANQDDPGKPSTQKMDDSFGAQLALLPGVEHVWPRYDVGAEVRISGTTTYLNISGVPNDMLQSFNLDFAWGGVPPKDAPLAFVFGDKVVESSFFDPMTGMPMQVDPQTDQFFVSFPDQSGGGPGIPVEPGVPANPQTPSKPATRFLIPVAGVAAGKEGTWGPHSSMVYADLDALIKTLHKAFPGKALPGQESNSAGRPTGPFVYNTFVIQTTDIKAAEDLTTLMREQGYGINSSVEWRQQIQQQSMLIQAIFGGIGFISLLVAAIGIANTMLMSVYERTREIGIMKVLGAALADIRSIFLLESASIGFLGGVVGLLLSFGVSSLLNSTLGAGLDMGGTGAMQISVIPLWLMFGAVVFAGLIGTIAGLIPAQRAMRLSALAAIRSQ